MDTETIIYISAAAFIIYLTARVISFFLYRKNRCQKLQPKLPGSPYRLIYSDQKQVMLGQENIIYGKVLTNEKLNISGRPDYIYRHKNGELLIAELKSGEIGERAEPYFGDLMQLASYFDIAEECFGERALHGLIIYKDYMFKVKNTNKLRRMLKNVLKDMRDMLKDGEANPEASFVKCRNCMCNGTVCEFTD